MKAICVNVEPTSPNSLRYSWDLDALHNAPHKFEVEYPFKVCDYPGLHFIGPFLPITLALAFEEREYRFEGSIISGTPENFKKFGEKWSEIVSIISNRFFRKSNKVQFIPPLEALKTLCDVYPQPEKRPALLFGGGAESLLVLGRLLGAGERPTLVSLYGHGWIGSDPEKNPAKIAGDRQVAEFFKIPLLHVKNGSYKVLCDMQPALASKLAQPVFFANACAFTAMVAGAAMPLVAPFGITELFHGNERENDADDQHFCMSNFFTDVLAEGLAEIMIYRRSLGNLSRVEVFRELWQHFPECAVHQYSCFSNERQRWCHNCEKCFRYFMLFRLFNIEPKRVGMNEKQILKNFRLPQSEIVKGLFAGPCLVQMYEQMRSEANVAGNLGTLALLRECDARVAALRCRQKLRASIRNAVPSPVLNFLRQLMHSKS